MERDKNELSTEEFAKVEKIIDSTFTPDGMMRRITDALKQSFNAKRYHRILDIVTSPLGLRMTMLEAKKPDPADVGNFIAKLVTQPLPPERLSLIKKLDEDSHASDLAMDVTSSTLHIMLQATLGYCPRMLADMERKFADQQDQFRENMRNSILAMMAYTYREVSDDDLQEYAREYSDPDMRWFFDIVSRQINAEFRISGERLGRDLQDLLKNMPIARLTASQCEQ